MIGLLLVAAASAAPIVLYDLEGDDGGFTATGDAGQWEWGVLFNGPGAGFNGSRAWSTGRASDYLNASTDYLEIPVPPLGGLERPTLSFQHWYEISLNDYGWVEVDTGNGWATIEPLYGYPTVSGFTGASGGWRAAVFDLSEYGPAPAVRLVFQTDLSGVSAGWTVDEVAFHDGDVAAPRLSDLDDLADTDDLVGPYVVQVEGIDDTVVAAMELHWRVGGVETTTTMTQVGSTDTWRASIPAQLPDTQVDYWVIGTDGANSAREPVDGTLGFRVYLPAPTDLTGPAERIVATETALSWTAPTGRNEVLGYEVLRGDTVVATSTTTEATAPLAGDDVFTVRAVYAAGHGDRSEPFELDAAVPTVSMLEPREGWPGDTLRVALTGEYLLLVQDEVTAELGAGLSVRGVEVRDVDTAWLDVLVGESASVGGRTLTLTSGDVTLTVQDAFTVLDPDDRPHLTAIEPARVRQGDTGELVIEHTGAVEGESPLVDLGEGIIVNAVEVDANALVVTYTVTGHAPLGDRAVAIDDGVRVLDGVTLEVLDAVAPRADGCGTPVRPGAGIALIGLGLLAVRRRR